MYHIEYKYILDRVFSISTAEHTERERARRVLVRQIEYNIFSATKYR